MLLGIYIDRRGDLTYRLLHELIIWNLDWPKDIKGSHCWTVPTAQATLGQKRIRLEHGRWKLVVTSFHKRTEQRNTSICTIMLFPERTEGHAPCCSYYNRNTARRNHEDERIRGHSQVLIRHIGQNHSLNSLKAPNWQPVSK